MADNKIKEESTLLRRKNRTIILLIIIIIMLLLLGFSCVKLGKIGSSVSTTPVYNKPCKCNTCEEKKCESSEKQKCEKSKEKSCPTCKETPCNCQDWEEKNILRISSEGAKWDENANLNIFNNSLFDGEKIIAPHSKGTYYFYVTNEIGDHITYNIKLTDKMNNFVNMKYRLKLDNIYIIGSKDKYVSIDELHLEDIIVTKDSSSYYTLEWYWDDGDKRDTKAGNNYTEYTLEITVSAVKGALIDIDPA